MSALRVVAPVARVSASKARVARSAVAAKVSLRGPFFHLDRDGCESPPIGAVIPPRPPRAWTHRTVPFLRAARQGSLRRGPRLLRRRLRASRGCPQGTPRPETPPRRCRDFVTDAVSATRVRRSRRRRVDRVARRRFSRALSRRDANARPSVDVRWSARVSDDRRRPPSPRARATPRDSRYLNARDTAGRGSRERSRMFF